MQPFGTRGLSSNNPSELAPASLNGQPLDTFTDVRVDFADSISRVDVSDSFSFSVTTEPAVLRTRAA